jgi:hypothetical protein
MSFPNLVKLLPNSIHVETERLDLFGQDRDADLLTPKQVFRRMQQKPSGRRGHYLSSHNEDGGKVPQEPGRAESEASFGLYYSAD